MTISRRIAFLIRCGKVIATALIWIAWLIVPVQSSWAIHHRFWWHDFPTLDPDNYMTKATFIATKSPTNQITLVSFNDYLKGPASYTLLYADEYNGNSHVINNLINRYNVANNLHRGEVGFSEMIPLRSNARDPKFEIAVINTNRWEMRWRFVVVSNVATPVEWYEIHDTGGVELIQICFLGWLVLLPLAIFSTRLIFRKTKPATIQ